MKKFTNTTKGYNAPVFVATAIDYSTDATLAAFLAAAPVGEIIVIDENNARHTDAIGANESFAIAQKTTEGIKKTPLYKRSDVSVTKRAYVAPVKQVASVGWNGTGGATGEETIAPRQNFGLKIMETTEGYDPFPTWNFDYTTKHGDSIIDVMQNLAKAINDDAAPENKFNQRLVSAKVKANATYSNYAMGGTTPTLTATKGSKRVPLGGTTPTIDVVVGDLIALDNAGTPTDSVGDVYKVVGYEAGVAITLNRPYTGETKTFTEAEAEGTRIKKVATVEAAGLVLTSLEDDAHFQVAVNENLINADVAYITPATVGHGTSGKVAQDEAEGLIWEGETTNMVAMPERWGQQDKFTVGGETYDYVIISYTKAIQGIAPNAEYRHRGRVTVALPKSAGNIDATFDTLFGL